MRLHISQSTKALLKEKNYRIVERGKLEIKGKGKRKKKSLPRNPLIDHGITNSTLHIFVI